MSGETEIIDLTDTCDPETKEGEKILREKLKGLTDMMSSKRSMQYRCVDIGLPIPFLKVHMLKPRTLIIQKRKKM